MGESSDQTTRRSKSSESIITAAINMIAMGVGITAAIIAANKSKAASNDASRIEKSVSELNTKFDKISEQLKSMQPAKMDVPVSSSKKADGVAQQQQPKPQQDVIYVRKSSEFSFYN